jgi:threonyl-tRNA synthetase
MSQLDRDSQLYRIRHSAAHVMAEAVIERFKPDGPVTLGVGPAIAEGFYYDFGLPRPATDEDLAWIEDRMKSIVTGKHEFRRRVLTEIEARAMFAEQPFKLELIDGFMKGAVDDDGNPVIPGGSGEVILTVYEHSGFVDLCQGPHVATTAEISKHGIKVMKTAGCYWKGDERNPQLTRIYGVAFATGDELKAHLARLAEAERRDHRRLGKQLELIHFEPTAPGMPYWLPKGWKIFNLLVDYWREQHELLDYQEISSPLINEKSLWETSGHWEHYKDNMFLAPVSEHQVYGVKPMNCPNAMLVFNIKTRSYRDLPLRLSDCDRLHRHERSGTLHGLLRVQSFTQDDAHIFVTEAMIQEEYERIFRIVDQFYALFGMSYKFRIGTRPKDFIGDVETWNRAEAELHALLERRAGKGGYEIAEGDGAFYGPKVDIMMDDAIGRSWQTGTIQLDFQLPRRFNCQYIDSDGSAKTPVVIHRVIYGSLERFIGILIEHTVGAMPLWIAPEQVRVVPITEAHVPHCERVRDRLKLRRIRATVDNDSSVRMNAKIRNAELMKVPYILVVGDKEVETDAVSVRVRGAKNKTMTLPFNDFLDLALHHSQAQTFGDAALLERGQAPE